MNQTGAIPKIPEKKLRFSIDFQAKKIKPFLARRPSDSLTNKQKNTVVLQGIETKIMETSPELCHKLGWVPFYYRNLLFRESQEASSPLSELQRGLQINMRLQDDYLNKSLSFPEIILGVNTPALKEYLKLDVSAGKPPSEDNKKLASRVINDYLEKSREVDRSTDFYKYNIIQTIAYTLGKRENIGDYCLLFICSGGKILNELILVNYLISVGFKIPKVYFYDPVYERDPISLDEVNTSIRFFLHTPNVAAYLESYSMECQVIENELMLYTRAYDWNLIFGMQCQIPLVPDMVSWNLIEGGSTINFQQLRGLNLNSYYFYKKMAHPWVTSKLELGLVQDSFISTIYSLTELGGSRHDSFKLHELPADYKPKIRDSIRNISQHISSKHLKINSPRPSASQLSHFLMPKLLFCREFQVIHDLHSVLQYTPPENHDWLRAWYRVIKRQRLQYQTYQSDYISLPLDREEAMSRHFPKGSQKSDFSDSKLLAIFNSPGMLLLNGEDYQKWMKKQKKNATWLPLFVFHINDEYPSAKLSAKSETPVPLQPKS